MSSCHDSQFRKHLTQTTSALLSKPRSQPQNSCQIIEMKEHNLYLALLMLIIGCFGKRSVGDPLIEINIKEENESKITYGIKLFPPLQANSVFEDLGIMYGDQALLPVEAFRHAVEITGMFRALREESEDGSSEINVIVDYQQIGGTMLNAKLCHLKEGECSSDVKIENGQVTKIFWGDV